MRTIRALLWTVSFSALAAVAIDSTCVVHASENPQGSQLPNPFLSASADSLRIDSLKEWIQNNYASKWEPLDSRIIENIAKVAIAENKLGPKQDRWYANLYLKLYGQFEEKMYDSKYEEIHRKFLADISRKKNLTVKSELSDRDRHHMIKQLFLSLTPTDLMMLRKLGYNEFNKKFDELFIPALKDHAHSSLQ